MAGGSGSLSTSRSALIYYCALPATLLAAFAAAAYLFNKKRDSSSSVSPGRGNFAQEENDNSKLNSSKNKSDKQDGGGVLLEQNKNSKVVVEEIKDIVASSKSTTSESAPINIKTKKIIEEDHNTSWSDLIEDEERQNQLKNNDEVEEEIQVGLTNLRLSPTEEQSRPNTADSNTNGASDNGLGGSLCEEGENSSSNSVVCSDSGRGSEPDDVTAGSSNTTGTILAYHFHIPSRICGKLIGAKGAAVNQLKATSKCRIILKEFGNSSSSKSRRRRKLQDESIQNNEFQICIIEGTRTGIEKCLELIRERFPLNEFPDLSLDQVNTPNNNNMSPALQLASGVMNEVQVSTIVSPCHVFLQQPSHPTFPALERLNACMFRCYTELNTPQLEPSAIDVGVVCVALCDNSWYRVQIVSPPYGPTTTSEYCDVKFLDYGGYISLPVSNLRQIRSDFLSLPFQAIECYLANITPPAMSDVWPVETAITLEEIISCKIGTASWIGVAEDGIPMVHLFVNDSANPHVTINVNRELVDRDAASWIEHSPLESPATSPPAVEANDESSSTPAPITASA